MRNLSVVAVVVCDDVRKEVTNKDILIGVYGGGIIVPAFPVTIPIAIWMQLHPKTAGQQELQIRISLPGSVRLEMQLIMEIKTIEDPVGVHTPQAVCLVREAGLIEISAREPPDEEWHLLKKVRVSQGVAPVTSSAS